MTGTRNRKFVNTSKRKALKLVKIPRLNVVIGWKLTEIELHKVTEFYRRLYGGASSCPYKHFSTLSLAFKVSPLNWVSCLILLKVLFPTVLKIFADWIGVEGSIGARDLTFHFGSRIQYLSQSHWFSIYRFQDCFTYLDRGFVFQMISYYSEQFKDSDTQVMLCCTLTISIKMIMVSL